ncbi:hypothetical protein B0J14DRAFT_45868 [Halenospora varia]|nr:hypothetical protein B0J14DRAFT_45868 [Halenospora varia]
MAIVSFTTAQTYSSCCSNLTAVPVFPFSLEHCSCRLAAGGLFEFSALLLVLLCAVVPVVGADSLAAEDAISHFPEPNSHCRFRNQSYAWANLHFSQSRPKKTADPAFNMQGTACSIEGNPGAFVDQTRGEDATWGKPERDLGGSKRGTSGLLGSYSSLEILLLES